MVYLRCDVCFCLNAFKLYIYLVLYVFCWFISYENELNVVIMCPLETGFEELDGSYIITLLYLVTQLLEWKKVWRWSLC